MILSAAERSERDRHKFSPVALAQWLLSRAAAKEASRQSSEPAPRLADILIEPAASGGLCSLLPNRESFFVSVGQQLFFTVGVAAPTEQFVGVGLSAEVLRPLEAAQRDIAFDPVELARLHAAAAQANESEHDWLRFGLAAKEAFWKANNSTSPTELSRIEIGSIDTVNRCFSVLPAMASVAHRDSHAPTAYQATETSLSLQEHADGTNVYCRVHNQHVLALCLIHRETTY